MSIRDIVSRVRNELKELNYDSLLTNRQIWSMFYTQGVLLMQRVIDQKRNIYNNDIFTKWETKMIPIGLETELIDIDYQCNIYKSAKPVPNLVETQYGAVLRNVSTLDNSISYNLVSPFDFQVKTKIKGNKARYIYLQDGYIYSKDPYPIKVEGLFKSYLPNSCKIMDMKAPILPYLIQPSISGLLQELGIYKQLPIDQTDNKTTQS